MEEKEKDIEKERQERRNLLNRSIMVRDDETEDLRKSTHQAYEMLKKKGFFMTTPPEESREE